MSDITLTITDEEPVALKIVEAALKPEQEKSVEPGYDPQTVLPDAGCVLSAVHVGAIPPVVLQDKSVTPTKQTQTVTADAGYDGLDAVEVTAIPDEYIVPTGKKQISITQNGTTLHDVTDYADAEIITDVSTDPANGLVFGDYDADGQPHSARIVGMTTIPPNYANSVFYSFGKNVTLTIPADIIKIGNVGFSYPRTVSKVIYEGNVPDIEQNTFANSSSVTLYDFSHATRIPVLYNVATLGHANGCVLRIPAALSDTTLGVGNGWESAANWSVLTGIVWEVV